MREIFCEGCFARDVSRRMCCEGFLRGMPARYALQEMCFERDKCIARDVLSDVLVTRFVLVSQSLVMTSSARSSILLYLKRAYYTNSHCSHFAFWWQQSQRSTSSQRLATSHISGGNTALRSVNFVLRKMVLKKSLGVVFPRLL